MIPSEADDLLNTGLDRLPMRIGTFIRNRGPCGRRSWISGRGWRSSEDAGGDVI